MLERARLVPPRLHNADPSTKRRTWPNSSSIKGIGAAAALGGGSAEVIGRKEAAARWTRPWLGRGFFFTPYPSVLRVMGSFPDHRPPQGAMGSDSPLV